MPDEARLRMSRAVPSPAATDSAARRGRGGFVSSISRFARGLFGPAWPRSPGSDLERLICRIERVLECANFLKPCLKRRPCRSNGIATGQELLGGLSMPAIFTRASPRTYMGYAVTPPRPVFGAVIQGIAAETSSRILADLAKPAKASRATEMGTWPS